jgi:hypothetical protein
VGNLTFYLTHFTWLNIDYYQLLEAQPEDLFPFGKGALATLTSFFMSLGYARCLKKSWPIYSFGSHA